MFVPFFILFIILSLHFLHFLLAAETILLAFQNYILMLGTSVMIPSLLVPLMGGTDVSSIVIFSFSVFMWLEGGIFILWAILRPSSYNVQDFKPVLSWVPPRWHPRPRSCHFGCMSMVLTGHLPSPSPDQLYMGLFWLYMDKFWLKSSLWDLLLW